MSEVAATTTAQGDFSSKITKDIACTLERFAKLQMATNMSTKLRFCASRKKNFPLRPKLFRKPEKYFFVFMASCKF